VRGALDFACVSVEDEGLLGLAHIAASSVLRAMSESLGGGARLLLFPPPPPIGSWGGGGDGRGAGGRRDDDGVGVAVVVARTGRPDGGGDDEAYRGGGHAPPFAFRIALLVADAVLSAVSPMLVRRPRDGVGEERDDVRRCGGREDRYRVRRHPSRLTRAEYGAGEDGGDCSLPARSHSPPPPIRRRNRTDDAGRLSRRSTMMWTAGTSPPSSASSSPPPADENYISTSVAPEGEGEVKVEKEEDDDDDGGGTARYFDPSGFPRDDDDDDDDDVDEVDSVYFDAAASIPSLSTASYGSSSQPTEEEDDGDHRVDDGEIDGSEDSPIPSHVDFVVVAEGEEDSSSHREGGAVYYLDVSDVASEVGQLDFAVVGGKSYYAAGGRAGDAASLGRVLDALLGRSLRMSAAAGDDGSPTTTTDGDIPRWKPDDRTRKFLDQRRRRRRDNDDDDDGGSEEEWEHVLRSEVLQWTGSEGDSGMPMLRTRGVVDMTPSRLEELLLDCDGMRDINKNLIHKENVVVFADPGVSSSAGGGGGATTTTKIVRHVMKVPVVGSTIRGLSLTHSRRLEDGGYVIVSRSVVSAGDDDSSSAMMEPANPYCSTSILRPVPNSDRTELTNVARTSSMPIPKFLVQKVASMAAVDFFNNLRHFCKEEQGT
jgi:hypothetical protein